MKYLLCTYYEETKTVALLVLTAYLFRSEILQSVYHMHVALMHLIQ